MARITRLAAGVALAAFLLPSLANAQSAEEIKQLFQQMDSDGNGEISPAEMSALMGGQATPGMVKMNIVALDADASGGLSEPELAEAATMVNGQPSDEQMQRVFNYFDSDGNQLVDRAELTDSMQALGQYSGEGSVDEALAEADGNGDGAIDLGEFMQLPR
ncbi:MAG: hypothetical protein Kilf2KO_20830 [Rhodospirillales bacterium]